MGIVTSEIPAKGLGVLAAEPISAGDVILVEHPLLVYPQASAVRSACNVAGLSEEHHSAVHFLIRACSLLIASMKGDTDASTRFKQLAELAGRGVDVPDQVVAEARAVALELHGRVCHALTVAGASTGSIDVNSVASLLERDAVNGYGIAMPRNLASDEMHSLRGTALYALASRINHECLPNVARFDDFDASEDNTALHFRALHALPAGEEVTQSYFPLTWTFEERQQRCKEHYGFNCTCPRCKEESTWGAPGDILHGNSNGAATSGSEADPAYIHLFLLKYVCPLEGCGGTMAPMPCQNNTLQCNVCGNSRTEAEFLEEVERDMQG